MLLRLAMTRCFVAVALLQPPRRTLAAGRAHGASGCGRALSEPMYWPTNLAQDRRTWSDVSLVDLFWHVMHTDILERAHRHAGAGQKGWRLPQALCFCWVSCVALHPIDHASDVTPQATVLRWTVPFFAHFVHFLISQKLLLESGTLLRFSLWRNSINRSFGEGSCCAFCTVRKSEVCLMLRRASYPLLAYRERV